MKQMNFLNTHESTVIDSSAYIEYLTGTKRGKQVEERIENKQLVMCTANIMEICVYAQRKGIQLESFFREALQKVLTFHVDSELAANASRLYFMRRKQNSKFAYADALAYMTADELGTTLITCDQYFEGMKNVIVIE